MGIEPAKRQKISRIVSTLLFVVYALIVSRLVHVHVTAAPVYAAEQEAFLARSHWRRGNEAFERGTRGRIVDARGQALALGFDTWSLVVDPNHGNGAGRRTLLDRLEICARALDAVGVSFDRDRFLREGMTEGITVVKDGVAREIPCRRRVLVTGLLPYQRDYLKSVLGKKMPEFTFEAQSTREYPEGELVSEVVGFTARSQADAEDRSRGRAGVELTLDKLLEGTNGEFFCEKDARGVEFDLSGHWLTRPRDGLDVGLTLDVRMQGIVDRALRRIAEGLDCACITGIVLETRTGRILAIRSLPSWSPEGITRGDVDPQDTTCRAVTHVYPPGSTFKPFIAAKALDLGLIRWSDRWDTNRGSKVFTDGRARRTVRDSHPSDILDTRGVIVESSNIAMAMMALDRMGFDRVHDAVEGMGFREKTGVLLPAEAGGQYVTKDEANRFYFTASVSFGQEIDLTPLSLAAHFSIFGADGVYHEPTLVDWVGNEDEKTYNRRSAVPMLSERAADEMLAALVGVVEEGTASALKKLPWSTAAKTGTAQIFQNGRQDGYSSSVVAIAPARDPMITVYVGVHGLHGSRIYGNQVAGPAVAEIIEGVLRKLGVPEEPDRVREGR